MRSSEQHISTENDFASQSRQTSRENTWRRDLEQLLDKADVQIGGTRPWDLRVHDERFYRRVLSKGSMGLGDSYMDGWWDCPQLDEFFTRILRARLHQQVLPPAMLLRALLAHIYNYQKISRAFEVGQKHYDIGNELYRQMLGESMIYSCGYWREAGTLEQAQEAKIDLVCRKLRIQPGMRVLDIGCGWGWAARHAAEKYGAQVEGITISREQARHAREICQGLPVKIHMTDYRKFEGKPFDRIFSIGMFEHVGYKNYREYMEVARRKLKKDGLFLLHTIGRNSSTANNDPWIEKYIFPNGMLPSISQISDASEGLFAMEDWHAFGPDYDRTLTTWHENFERAWPELRQDYDERFYRMWRYYLLSCAASFRARVNQLWQVLFSPHGVPGGCGEIR